MKRLMIVHNGCDGLAFVRLDDKHWGLDTTVGQPPWKPGETPPGWDLVEQPDANCFLKEEFRDAFLNDQQVDPRYRRTEMVLVSYFTKR